MFYIFFVFYENHILLNKYFRLTSIFQWPVTLLFSGRPNKCHSQYYIDFHSFDCSYSAKLRFPVNLNSTVASFIINISPVGLVLFKISIFYEKQSYSLKILFLIIENSIIKISLNQKTSITDKYLEEKKNSKSACKISSARFDESETKRIKQTTPSAASACLTSFYFNFIKFTLINWFCMLNRLFSCLPMPELTEF